MNHLFQQALFHHQNKRGEEAKRLYKILLQQDSKNFDVLMLLGLLLAEQGDVDEAIIYLYKAVKINPQSEPTCFNLAAAYSVKGQYQYAERFFKQVLSINPSNLKATLELSALCMRRGDIPARLHYLQKARQLAPQDPEILNDYGDVLRMMGDFEGAIKSISSSLVLNPQSADAINNLGRTYMQLDKLDEAKSAFEHALALKPDMVSAHINLGNLFVKRGMYIEATHAYDQALAFDSKSVAALTNRAQMWILTNEYQEALKLFQYAYAVDSNYRNLEGAIIDARLQLCDWENLQSQVDFLQTKIKNGMAATEPMIEVAVTNSLALQKKAAEIYFGQQFGYRASTYKAIPKTTKKIVVAYLSADFRSHPISFLMAELFEVHDREKFEIIGISFSSIKDEMQQRIAGAFDCFIEAHHISDDEVASILASKGVDIAIDLGGYTQNSRFGLFVQRVAPVQMSYLGYLGTTGSNCIDYIIADEEIIPKQLQKFYTEKIAYLPSYQVNDSKRAISSRQFTKSELGIPEDAFVYCCFNNNFKILPDTFASWMRILANVPNSVLFLFVGNVRAQNNLQQEAIKHGIDPVRLIFGGRLPVSEYLARYKVADIFLDTFPYNAGTTASDALWVGVPVLTRQGETFASRVASSLLRAVGLPELITRTVDEYEALACSLGSSPDATQTLKAKLSANKSTTPLFNTVKFARNIEKLYLAAHLQAASGKKFENIHLNPSE